jgi:uncharacterized membrane protein (Fun14 family)
MNSNPVNIDSSTDILSSTFLLGNVGAPFIIGLAVGFFAKKMLKIALFLGGAAVVVLFVTENYGIAGVSDVINLQDAANTATTAVRHSGSFLMEHLSNNTGKDASAAAGFFLGLKIG